MIGRRLFVAGLLASVAVTADAQRIPGRRFVPGGFRFLSPIQDFVPGYVPPAVSLVSRAITNQVWNAYSSGLASQNVTDGYVDVAVDVAFAASALTSTSSSSLFGKWNVSGTSTSANAAYLFGLSTGALRIASYSQSGNTFSDAVCSVKLNTVLAARQRKWLRAVLNKSAGTLNGFASGTCTFFTSDDGVTWDQLGAVVTGLGSAGIAQPTTVSSPFIGTLNAGNTFSGWFYRAIVRASTGTIRMNPDFTGLEAGRSASFVDTAGTPQTWILNCPISRENRVTLTPAHQRLRRAGSLKLKCLELLPIDPANGSWGAAMTNYNSANFEERIAYAAAAGANSCKITSSGDPTHGYPSAAVCEANIADYCRLLRKYGLKHYHSLAHSEEIAGADGQQRVAKMAGLAAHFALWMKHGYDLIVGVDLCNEVNFGFPTKPSTWPSTQTNNTAMANDLAYAMQEIRKVAPDMPLSFSVYINNKAELGTSSLLALQYVLDCEFHDYHPYYSKNGQANIVVGDAPIAADMATLEGYNAFLGTYLIGECGIRNNNSDAATAAWINGMAAQSARTASKGGVMFGDQNFTSGSEPGNYGIRPNPVMAAAFAAWAIA